MTERHELKEVQVKLRKLSAQEINEATKSKTVKPKHIVKKLKQSVKSTHAPAILRKDTIGTTPKFTFSTYKLARKKGGITFFTALYLAARKSLIQLKTGTPTTYVCTERLDINAMFVPNGSQPQIGLKITNTLIRKHGLSVVVVINPSIS